MAGTGPGLSGAGHIRNSRRLAARPTVTKWFIAVGSLQKGLKNITVSESLPQKEAPSGGNTSSGGQTARRHLLLKGVKTLIKTVAAMRIFEK